MRRPRLHGCNVWGVIRIDGVVRQIIGYQQEVAAYVSAWELHRDRRPKFYDERDILLFGVVRPAGMIVVLRSHTLQANMGGRVREWVIRATCVGSNGWGTWAWIGMARSL